MVSVFHVTSEGQGSGGPTQAPRRPRTAAHSIAKEQGGDLKWAEDKIGPWLPPGNAMGPCRRGSQFM